MHCCTYSKRAVDKIGNVRPLVVRADVHYHGGLGDVEEDLALEDILFPRRVSG